VQTPLKSRITPQGLESTNRLMSKTIDVMGAGPENDEDCAFNQSQSPRKLQQHLYWQLRGKGEYRKNKYEGENAKFPMGSFDRKRGSTHPLYKFGDYRLPPELHLGCAKVLLMIKRFKAISIYYAKPLLT
jgi:hypothetical protein